MNKSKETILVIEDEKNILELVKYNLEQEGYRVLTANRGDSGLEIRPLGTVSCGFGDHFE